MEDTSSFVKAMEDTSADVFLPSVRCARSSDLATFEYAPRSWGMERERGHSGIVKKCQALRSLRTLSFLSSRFSSSLAISKAN